jgi:hypothetical protein
MIQPQPHLFRHSLDWRFLLPISDPEKACVLLEENDDLRQALERVGIGVSRQLTLAELRSHKTHSFQSVVLPFGLPCAWVGAQHEEQVKLYTSIRRFISPGGDLLVGFHHLWNFRGNSPRYHACTPRRMMDQLRRAGFPSIRIFGAMPNLTIPDHVFELEDRPIQFALQNRFRRKPAVLRVLRTLAGIVGWGSIANFLPCYFAVATVEP